MTRREQRPQPQTQALLRSLSCCKFQPSAVSGFKGASRLFSLHPVSVTMCGLDWGCLNARGQALQIQSCRVVTEKCPGTQIYQEISLKPKTMASQQWAVQCMWLWHHNHNHQSDKISRGFKMCYPLFPYELILEDYTLQNALVKISSLWPFENKTMRPEPAYLSQLGRDTLKSKLLGQ